MLVMCNASDIVDMRKEDRHLLSNAPLDRRYDNHDRHIGIER